MKQISASLLDAQKENGKQLEELYDRMANREFMDESERQMLKQDVDSCMDVLQSTVTNTRRVWQKALANKDELETRYAEVAKRTRKRRIIPKAPSNTEIDYQEEKEQHFARGINGYKIFWIIFVGSFFGVIVELLFCLVKNGYLESRAGLVYGPFNPVYGFGAMALTLALYRYRNRDVMISFVGGLLVGSVVEYLCSFVQELVFGTRSWDYSAFPFNINGRICLQYSIFWGFLGVLWIKNLYPRLAQLILRIPDKIGRIATWILLVFLTFNCVMSIGAAYRWSRRQQNIQPANQVEQFFDNRFPDERMQKIYSNIMF